MEEVRPILDRQVAFNTAIAEEGHRSDWDANIGSVLLRAYRHLSDNEQILLCFDNMPICL